MGFAKYAEDNFEIWSDRMSNSNSMVSVEYSPNDYTHLSSDSSKKHHAHLLESYLDKNGALYYNLFEILSNY